MLKSLTMGWLIGAGVLIALSARGVLVSSPRLDPAQQQVLPVAVAVPMTGPSSEQPIIPVAGITAGQLHDTFDDARGGGSRVHHAMDILAPRGTPVVAAVDGTIRKLFSGGAGGLTIYQFDMPQQRIYYYAHLDHYAAGLGEGLFVKQGTVIGYVGTTGNAPPGTPHLHFSIENLPATKEWWKGVPVNPYPVLAR
ncbi:MAG: peptidoglycan LD-endopeptidase LytH [Acidobacteriota bacterium]|jgi:murein DD-endopeptidase MepM/ murein hydrolase activator NlpD|nr:peptidoglycan LD-endopeptidase LytH [Acidobacteriota bacterium]